MSVFLNNKVLVLSHYLLNDPPTKNTIRTLLKEGLDVIFFQQAASVQYSNEETAGFRFINIADFPSVKPAALRSVLKWLYYRKQLRKLMRQESPGRIVTFMLHPLAALPADCNAAVFSCIYDIPATTGIGKLDKFIYARGFKRLGQSTLVWASDIQKATLCAQRANLREIPLVCHNVPPLGYYTELPPMKSSWLREFLQTKGISCTGAGNSVLVRAGAIGPYGGIEETLKAMKGLPDNFVFVMAGRPSKKYLREILELVASCQLTNRVYIWENPDEITWKKILLGADIGHMIHVRPDASRSAYLAMNYDLNSSLSNNRLFQYMAAGLPILSYNDPRLNDIHNEVNCFAIIDTADTVNSIAAKWKYLADNSSVRMEMSNAGRQAHLTKYNWEFQFNPILREIC